MRTSVATGATTRSFLGSPPFSGSANSPVCTRCYPVDSAFTCALLVVSASEELNLDLSHAAAVCC